MNQQEIKEYNKSKKYDVFMGTIILCIIYAIIALILLLYASYTDSGKALYTNLKPFAIRYIIGTIIIIICFSIIILNYDLSILDSKNINKNPLNSTSCPDYYNTKIQKDTDVTPLISRYNDIEQNQYIIGADAIYNTPQSESTLNNPNYVDFYDLRPNKDNKHKFKVKCQLDTNIFDSNKLIKNNNDNIIKHIEGTSGTGVIGNTALTPGHYPNDTNLNGKEINTMVGALLAMENGYSSASSHTPKKINDESDPPEGYNFKCDHVYPEYLTSLDLKEYNTNGQTGPINKYRCEFAKQCGINWSEAGC
jgi:hemin uptake protein HemP